MCKPIKPRLKNDLVICCFHMFSSYVSPAVLHAKFKINDHLVLGLCWGWLPMCVFVRSTRCRSVVDVHPLIVGEYGLYFTHPGHSVLPNLFLRWCEHPHTHQRGSQRSGPGCSPSEMLCWPAGSCRAVGGTSRKFGCGVWSRKTFSVISTITRESGKLCPTSRSRSPEEISLQDWQLTCSLKLSQNHLLSELTSLFGKDGSLVADQCESEARTARQSKQLALFLHGV